MNIGVPNERRPSEFRVGLTPPGVRLLTELGHQIYVERGAGEGAGFSEDDYRSSGAQMVYSGEEAYGRADIVLKIQRPLQEEMGWVRQGQAILGFLHLNSANRGEVQPLLDRQVTAIAYERIQAADGSNPVLRPFSQIGGWMAAPLAARLLQNNSGNRGVLLGGVPGVPPAEVVIIGAGTVGQNAARAFQGLGAQLTILDEDLSQLQAIEDRMPCRPVTMLANPHTLATACSFADVVVGAVRRPGGRTPILIPREMLRRMKPGALIIDLSIDEGGIAETSRPTSHMDPTFVEEGVVHCCIPNLPSAVARTACYAFQSAAWPYLRRMVSEGVEAVIDTDPGVQNAAMIKAGEPLHYRPVPYLTESDG
ncbi:MAG: alanine dehydrogenase [Anaerolineales bacterium]